MAPKRASSRRSDAVSSQNGIVAPQSEQPAPPPPPPAGVTQDQFSALFQQVQALTTAVQVMNQNPGVRQEAGQPSQHPLSAPNHLTQPPAAAGVPERADLPPAGSQPPEERLRRDRSRSPRRARGRSPDLPSDRDSTSNESLPRHSKVGAHLDDAVSRRLAEMQKKIEALDKASTPKEGVGINLSPPFTSEIMKEPLPPNFKVPQLESYDGTGDPSDHIESFRALMLLHQASDAILCRAFPSTLKASARHWFSGLKPASIGSFAELGQNFVSHFISRRRHRRGSDYLSKIKQGESESLRSYVGRFTSATLEVHSLDHSVAITAMMNGLQKSQFLFSLKKKHPQTFSEMLTRANKYADAEEEFEAHTAPTSEKQKEALRRIKDPAQRQEETGKRHLVPRISPPRRPRSPPRRRQDRYPRERVRGDDFPPRRFDNFTPLIAPRAEVLMEVGEQLPPPIRMQAPAGHRNPDKYCLYHRDHGHDTEDCYQLRREIEQLIRRGGLGRFVQQAPAQRRSPVRRQNVPRPRPQPEQPPPPVPEEAEVAPRPVLRQINMIREEGQSSSALHCVKKPRVETELLSFTE